jgi:hypothetical protein
VLLTDFGLHAVVGVRSQQVLERRVVSNLFRVSRDELRPSPPESPLDAPLSGHVTVRFTRTPLSPLREDVHRSRAHAHLSDGVLATIAWGYARTTKRAAARPATSGSRSR